MAEPKPRRMPRRADIGPLPAAEADTASLVYLADENAAAPIEAVDLVVPMPAESQPVLPPTIAPTEPEIAAEVADEPISDPVGHPWAMLAEAHSALTRGIGELAAEMSGLTQSSVAAGADAAIALLGSRTFAEAVEINAGLARRGFDTLVEGSAKLSEICVKAVTAASRPMLVRSRFS